MATDRSCGYCIDAAIVMPPARSASTSAHLPMAVWLSALLVSAVLVWRAPFLTDLSVFLPQRPTPEQRLLVQNLTEGVASRLLLVGIDGVAPARQAELSNALAARLRSDLRLRSVNNGALDGLRSDQKLLFERRYALSPAVTASAFEVPALRAALERTIDELSSSMGAFAGELALRDPTGETLRLVESLTAGQSPRLHDGVWVSADGHRLMMLLHTQVLGSDLDAQQAVLQGVDAAFDAETRRLGLDTAVLKVSGPGKFAVESRRSIKEDVERLSLVGTSLVLALLWWAFRSPWAIAMALVPIGSAVLVAAAAVATVFGSIHGLTIGFGATLVGESVDYALYHLGRLASREPAPQGAFWRTIRTGVLTSVVGFGALLFTGFPGLAQLAVFSIAGILVAALVTRFVLPGLTPAHFRPRDLSGLGDRLLRVLRAVRAGRLALSGVLGLLLCVALFVGLGRRDLPLWNPDIASLNPISSAAQSLHEQLERELGAPSADLMVIASGTTEAQTLELAWAVGRVLDGWVAQGRLSGYDSPARLLPPARVQLERLAGLPESTVLAERLNQAAQGLAIRPDKLTGFLDDVNQARSAGPVTRADLAGTQLGLRVDSLLVTERAALITLRPSRDRPIDVQALREALEAGVPTQGGAGSAAEPGVSGSAGAAGAQVSLLAPKAETDKLYGGYLREAAWLSAGGALAIVVLLAFSLRSWAAVLRVCAPLAGAVLLVIAGFMLAGRSMNLLHLVGLLLVVAIGSNYALFMHSLRAGDLAGSSCSGTLASLVLANLTTLAGFSVLAFSSVPLLAALGTTVGMGAALALVLSGLWIGPGSN